MSAFLTRVNRILGAENSEKGLADVGSVYNVAGPNFFGVHVTEVGDVFKISAENAEKVSQYWE